MSPVLFFTFPDSCHIAAVFQHVIMFFTYCAPSLLDQYIDQYITPLKKSLNASKPLFLRLSPVFVYEVNSNACVLLGDFVYALLSPILEFSSSCPCLQTYFSVVLHRLLSSRILF